MLVLVIPELFAEGELKRWKKTITVTPIGGKVLGRCGGHFERNVVEKKGLRGGLILNTYPQRGGVSRRL